MPKHQMITRSKGVVFLKDNNGPPIQDNPPTQDDDDVDEYGNINDLIDYRGDNIKPKKTKLSKKLKKKQLNIMQPDLLSLMISTLINSNKNLSIHIPDTPTSKKKMRIIESEEENNVTDEEEINGSDGRLSISIQSSEDNDYNGHLKLDEEEEDEDEDEEEEDEEEYDEDDEDDEDEDDYDELDEKFMEIEENLELDEDENINYFHKLEKDKKTKYLSEIKKLNEINELNMPLKFKILNSDMDLNTKAIAMRNIEKLNEMDVSTGEYSKMDKWINGLISIPFNKFVSLSVNNNNTIEEKREFIVNTKSILDKSIYGHNDAKTHILQVIGKWIKNPQSQGNVLALQGPMGNGKTTLVKEGIAKAIGRPFSFIALGGQSDSSLFEGHSYTYEGSHWGRIIDILIESRCMNPVIYFDELDKVSETFKGEEIIHMLTHLTDPSQNSLFQDNYYPGINIDLSKVLFIFSFNDESKVNRVLKDRMYVINTKGFNTKEKNKICRDYVLPELYDTYLFKHEDIIINDDILEYVIDKFTNKEEGVRNLKRCIESIISKINIYYLTGDSNNIDLNFKIKDFKLPYIINREDIDNFLKLNNPSEQPPQYMYM